MGTLNAALQIMTGALNANQGALNATSDNIANANTPGYTREVPIFQSNDAVVINGISYGQGVRMSSVQSQRSVVLNAGIQQQTQSQQATNSEWAAMQQVQTIFNQVTTGSGSTPNSLGDQVTGLFNSMTALEATPASVTLRENVLSVAGTLASTFNNVAAQLGQQTATLNQQVQGVVQQINPLLTSIAQLNQQIISASPRADAGQLEDQRQADLQQLSQYIGVNVIQTEDNGLTITTTGGATLVSKGQTFQLTTGNVAGKTDVFSTAPGTAQNVTTQQTSGGGQLGGLLAARDNDIPAIQNQMDTFANGLATQINIIQAAGVDVNGNPGVPFFNIPVPVAGSAAGISVALTSPSQIAAAATGTGPGDSTNLQAMANLANQAIIAGDTPADYYSSFIGRLGSQISGLNTQNLAQQASLSQVQGQQNSLSAVSLNEEAANLQTYERAYQSA
ncbi:MAG: flagellar hook-associated protein FlgK, partial [Acidobacteriaceae bacterium]